MIRRVNEHGTTILQIKMPVPYPLSFVNSYLILGSGGYTLLDPGLNTEEARQAWYQVFEERNIQFKDIEKIVLTHHHPDHYGLAGWFQAENNAPVYMSETAYNQAVHMWGERTTINAQLIALFIQHGMDDETASSMLPHLESFLPFVSPQPEVTFINESHSIMLGDREYDIIQADGHASGHLCFLNRYNGDIFCGDQVLPQITPNVSYMPAMDANPLASFLASLNELSKLSVSKAYPGHRQPFANFSERALEIIAHHEERLQAMLHLLKTPHTAYEICRLTFGHRLSTHQLRFAMSETLAHIIYLHLQGKIQQHNEGKTIVFVQ